LFPINYAVTILFGVFILSAMSWILFAHKWFKGPGPIPNITADEIAKAGGHVPKKIHSEPLMDKLSEVEDKMLSDKLLHTKPSS